MQKSSEFGELRSAFRGFTIPIAIAALVWFVGFTLAAMYLPEVMARTVLGLNLGIWLGFAQFFTTFLITWVYIGYANKNFEPRQSAIRSKMEG
ncbi:DUF485 domain-containing protein [Corynebacterium tapiri]|nr:DUF485 domain-containing protein [Corynebacterium tapiri]